MECNCCPFECRVDRISQFGVCGAPDKFKIANIMAHFWEEPCLSGTSGSGTVFFSHCNASCLFCQNYQISQLHKGSIYEDEQFITNCQEFIETSGVHNLNLVSPTHYTARLIKVLPQLKKKIRVPILWNSNGYEKESFIKKLEGLVDIFLPDFKYFDNALAARFSHLPDYFHYASRAIEAMKKIVNKPIFNQEGIMQRGLIIRHLILPGHGEDSKKILRWIAENLGTKTYISLMAQYYPVYQAHEIIALNQRLTPEEYKDVEDYFLHLGFENGFCQKLDANSPEYTPQF